MSWEIQYSDEAKKDFKRLAGNQQNLVRKALNKVSVNPVSIFEGGYGKPLGKQHGMDLTGCYKIKLRDAGIRVIYRLVRTKTTMSVVVIGMRADDAAEQALLSRHYFSEK